MPGSPERRPGVRPAASGLLVVALAVGVGALGPGSRGGTAAAATDERAGSGRTVLRLADPRIDESSGLLRSGRLLLTVNDSGDDPVVYAVDAGSGATVGVTRYGNGEVVDVEALAAGPDGSVWVGDIGDNQRARSAVTVYRLPSVTAGDRSVSAVPYTFTYPGRPRDAEALLVHPRTGRLFVVTKELVAGGTVYAAPAALEAGAIHRLRPVAEAPRLVTDGGFWPDGRHLVLRTYGAASLYAYPGFTPLGGFELPEQEQGEGLAPAPGGRLWLSTEGALSEVLDVALPADLRQAVLGPPADQGQGDGQTVHQGRDADDPAPQGDGAVPAGLAGLAVLAVLAGGAGVAGLWLRAARRRSRRRW